MSMKNFASYCDTETRFHDTEEQAVDAAIQCIQAMREDTFDGWDELTTDNIVVMQVTHRAAKIDPNAPYQNIDYHLTKVGESSQSAGEKRDMWRSLALRLSRHLLNPDQMLPLDWGARGGELLSDVQAADPLAYRDAVSETR